VLEESVVTSPDTAPTTTLEPEQIRVLLAEDDSTQRLALQHLVKCERYQTLATSDGREALKHILADHFDILLTDLDMPGLNGEELCREIREAKLPHYVYILILSANVEDEKVAAGLRAGADDFLRKPVAPVELVARLRNATRVIHLMREQRRNSITDELTQLYNRRYLTTQLRYETFRAKRYQHALSVLVFDLDHFKLVNDQHGHPVGDQVLQLFSQTIQPLLRDCDWLARYGGEEFVAVLPEISLEQAVLTAERFRQQLNHQPLHTRVGPLNITTSIGVAAFAPDKEDSDTLLARADKALYASKQLGRDRVTASPTP
jgi:two-component system, cell cycle response regulator